MNACRTSTCMTKLSEWGDFIDKHGEKLYIALFGVVSFVSIIVETVHPIESYENTALYQSINAGTVERAYFANNSIIAISIAFLITVGFDLSQGALTVEEQRISVSSRLVHIFGLMLPRIAASDWSAQGHEILFSHIHKERLCRVVAFTLATENFYILLGALLFFSDRIELYRKPRFLLPLLLLTGIHSVIGLFVDSVDEAPYWLNTLYQVSAFPHYVFGIVGSVKILAFIRACLSLRETLGGHLFDLTVMVCIVALWYIVARFVGNLAFPNSRDIDIDTWAKFDSGSCAVFLLVVIYHAADVTKRRMEERRMRILAAERSVNDLKITNSQLLHKEREIAIKLLHSMVPPKIARDLSNGVEVPAQMYEFAIVYNSNIQGFTKFAAIAPPSEVFHMLERFFMVMDHCLSLFPKLYKVQTAGHFFMVVGGILDSEDRHDTDNSVGQSQHEFLTIGSTIGELSNDLSMLNARSSKEHRNSAITGNMCTFALLARDVAQKVQMDHTNFVRIQIGIHCGSVITGLCGDISPHYLVFGDTVTTAGLLQSTGSTSKIHISSAVQNVLYHSPWISQYAFEKRSPISIKDKSKMQTFFLECDADLLHASYAAELRKIDEIVKKSTLVGASVGQDAFTCAESPREKKFQAFHVPQLEIDDSIQLIVEDPAGIDLNENSHHEEMNAYGSFNELRNDSDHSFDENRMPYTFEEIVSEDFNLMSIEISDFESIVAAMTTLVVGLVGNLEDIDVSPSVFDRFCRRISTFYRETPYHNWHHALCVMRETVVIIKVRSGAVERFDKKALFVMMIAAMVHDVDHPGTNNDFEVKSMSRLALLYNDNSVLENHHLSLTFNVLLDKNYNVFARRSVEECRLFRLLMTTAILATDMAVHNTLQIALQSRSMRTPAFDFDKFDDRLEFLKIVLHTADIFNAARPAAISSRISQLIVEEFRHQSELEKDRGLPVTQYMVMKDELAACKGELGFSTYMAKPFFQAWADCFPFNPPMNFVPNVDANIAYWQGKIDVLSSQSLATNGVTHSSTDE